MAESGAKVQVELRVMGGGLRSLFRVYTSAYGATEFNPVSGHGRFHPFVDITGQSVSTLYGAMSVDGALSETVFHDIPMGVTGRPREAGG